MAGGQRQRGLFLPGLAQALLLLAAICGGWWVWQEIRPVPELPSLEDNPTARLQSLEFLVRRGSDAIPGLIEMLSDEDPRTRRDAVLALGRIGPAGPESLEAVRARLEDTDAAV